MSNPTNSVYNLKIIVLKKSWLVGETHFEKVLQKPEFIWLFEQLNGNRFHLWAIYSSSTLKYRTEVEKLMFLRHNFLTYKAFLLEFAIKQSCIQYAAYFQTNEAWFDYEMFPS